MPHFSKTSQSKLDTCHPDIVLICNEVIKNFDYSILEGSRLDSLQYKYFLEGKSKLDGINDISKHQVMPEEPLSKAVDVAPYPIDFRNDNKAKARFYMLAGYFFQAAAKLLKEGKISHTLKWGGDWNGNKDFKDQSFDDLPHFQIEEI